MNTKRRQAGLDAGVSHTEQAAMVLMSLDQEEAVAVLRELPPEDIERLSEAMLNLQHAERGAMASVLQRFFRDAGAVSGIGSVRGERIRGMLDQALGSERGRLLGERIVALGPDSQLSKLQWLDAEGIARLMQGEHPQLQTVLLACLSARQASEVLMRLHEPLRVDLLERLAGLQAISSLALQELEAVLSSHFAEGGGGLRQAVTGEKLAAALLREMDVDSESALLAAMSSSDPERVARIEDMMFDFSSLVQLDEGDLRLVLEQIAPALLASALAGIDAGVRNRLLRSLDRERRRAVNRLLLEARPGRRAADAARDEIVKLTRRLAEVGEIVLDSRRLAAL